MFSMEANWSIGHGPHSALSLWNTAVYPDAMIMKPHLRHAKPAVCAKIPLTREPHRLELVLLRLVAAVQLDLKELASQDLEGLDGWSCR